MKRTDVILSLIVLIAAFAVIFFQFTMIPADLTRDEVEFARLAVSLKDQWFTPYSPYATGHATLYFYIILASQMIFGLTPFALRLPSALFGVLTPVIIFWIFRRVFNSGCLTFRIPGLKKSFEIDTAFFLTLIFITMRWYFGFARFSFEATFLLFLESVSLLSMLIFVHSSEKTHSSSAHRFTKLIPLVLSAICAGLAYNSYQPGRIFFIVPLALMLLNQQTRTKRNVLLFGGIFSVIIAPLTVYLQQHPDIRITQQLYFADKTRTFTDKIGFLLSNIWLNVKLFFLEGDISGRHNYPGKPALNPVLFVFFLSGLISALRFFRNKMHVLFLLYFGIAMGPTLLTYPHENPNMLRTFTVLPSVVFFIGLGIYSWQQILDRTSLRKTLRSYFGTVIITLFILSAIFELRTYFIYQKRVFEEAFEVKDGMAGVYVFMVEQDIGLSGFPVTAAQKEEFEIIRQKHSR